MVFNSTHRQLQEYLSLWLEGKSSDSEKNFADIKQSVTQVYEEMGLAAPLIIPCRGPVQQILFPTLIGLMLQSERERSVKSNFLNPAGFEPPELATEWRSIWKKAFDVIDWSRKMNIDIENEAILNAQIENRIARKLKHQLTSYADQELGFEQNLQLEAICEKELQVRLDQLKRVLSFDVDETAYIWKCFLARLPNELKGLIQNQKNKSAKNLLALNKPNLNSWIGSSDWHTLAPSDFARTQTMTPMVTDVARELDAWVTLFKFATSYLFCEHLCFVYMKPIELFFDQSRRLHHTSRAAVDFLDGTQLYFWHGIEVDEEIILHPEKIKIKTIDHERNIEVKRIMIERYGMENFTLLARKIHEDEVGVLYVKEMPGDEPMSIVKVINSTAEPDGTFKTYFLRVPPQTKTAREGIAWTFGLTEEDYSPLEET